MKDFPSWVKQTGNSLLRLADLWGLESVIWNGTVDREMKERRKEGFRKVSTDDTGKQFEFFHNYTKLNRCKMFVFQLEFKFNTFILEITWLFLQSYTFHGKME